MFFGYFKNQISKCPYITSILEPDLSQWMQHGPSNKLILYISSWQTHCIYEKVLFLDRKYNQNWVKENK